MPILITCTSCGATLKAPDEAAGHRVKCRNCQAVIAVPAIVDAEVESDFEYVDPAPSAAPKPVAAKPVAAKPVLAAAVPVKAKRKPVIDADGEDDEVHKPKKKSTAVIDEEDEAPRKSKKKAIIADDDEEDETPRKTRKKGKKAAKKTNPMIFVLGGVGALFAVGFLGVMIWYVAIREDKSSTAGTTGTGPNSNPGTRQNPNPGGSNPDTSEVSADVVVREELIDPLGGQAKFKNSTIVVEGTVDKVFRRTDRGPIGAEVAVRLSTKTQYEPDGVLAYCECRPEDDTKAAELTIGQKVKMRGKSGVNTLNVMGCEILSVGPDPAVKMTLDELLAEFRKGDAAAMAKYKGKWFTITDAVIESKDENGREFKLVDKGKVTSFLEASRPYNQQVDQKQYLAAKAGDRITIKCSVSYGFPYCHFNECRIVTGGDGTGMK